MMESDNGKSLSNVSSYKQHFQRQKMLCTPTAKPQNWDLAKKSEGLYRCAWCNKHFSKEHEKNQFKDHKRNLRVMCPDYNISVTEIELKIQAEERKRRKEAGQGVSRAKANLQGRDEETFKEMAGYLPKASSAGYLSKAELKQFVADFEDLLMSDEKGNHWTTLRKNAKTTL